MRVLLSVRGATAAAILLCLGLALPALAAAPKSEQKSDHEIGYEQARDLAILVAKHDNIIVNDRDVVLNSMDTRNERGFIRGYYSFSVIHESNSPMEADTTIRMFAISKRTAEVWEMNLCREYSFPALEKIQQRLMRETGASPDDSREMPRDIGCATQAAQNHPQP